MNRERSILAFPKAIMVAAVTSGILALCAQTASAQTITVTTPFAFSVGTRYFPPGTYQFTVPTEWELSIRNVKGGGERFFLVMPETNQPTASDGKLVFASSAGHKELQAVYLSGGEYAVKLVQGHTARHKRNNQGVSARASIASADGAGAGNRTTP